MRTVVIVQARMASTRLPGKVLRPLGEGTVLSEVLRRCRAIPGIGAVFCAVPEAPESAPLIAEAERAGAVSFAGDESDVLSRYHGAAVASGADEVLRVTSDCPLIDPELCGAVIALRRETGADYACNNMPPSFPHGLDCEAFTAPALAAAAETATAPEAREHVTPWLRTAPHLRRAALAGPGGACVGQRWTLDHPEDYAFLRAVFDRLPPAPAIPPWRDVLAVVEREPALAAINAMHRSR